MNKDDLFKRPEPEPKFKKLIKKILKVLGI
jgi:hypothetical protein